MSKSLWKHQLLFGWREKQPKPASHFCGSEQAVWLGKAGMPILRLPSPPWPEPGPQTLWGKERNTNQRFSRFLYNRVRRRFVPHQTWPSPNTVHRILSKSASWFLNQTLLPPFWGGRWQPLWPWTQATSLLGVASFRWNVWNFKVPHGELKFYFFSVILNSEFDI